MMTFQSRWPGTWLTPYTDETLKMLGERDEAYSGAVPGFAPTVSKRWKKSPSRTGKYSSKQAASNMNIFRRLMRTQRILR